LARELEKGERRGEGAVKEQGKMGRGRKRDG
jgi:hypothetical protein